MRIGEVIPVEREIELNAGKKSVQVKVVHTGDRPVQVGSHFHFFEVNKMLQFDRAAAFGFRLDVPSGNAVRFEPGEEKVVTLVELGGNKRSFGLNNLTNDQAVPANLDKAMNNAKLKGFVK